MISKAKKKINLDDLYYHTSPFKAILKLSIPVMITQFILGIFTFINLLFMSLVIKGAPNANVISIFVPLYTVLMSSIWMFTSGSTARMSFYLGKGQYEQVKKIFNCVTINVLGLNSLFIIIGLACAYPIFLLLASGATNIANYAWDFFWPTALSMPFLAIGYLWGISFRNMGNQKVYVTLNVIMLASNVLAQIIMWKTLNTDNKDLQYTMIGICNLISAIVICVAAYVCYLLNKRWNPDTPLSLEKKYMFNNWSITKEIMKIGSPAIVLNFGVTVIGFLTNLVFHFVPIHPDQYILKSGTVDSNLEVHYWQLLFGAGYPIWTMLINPINGIIISGRVVAIYNYGKADFTRVKQSFRATVLILAVYMVLVEVILISAGQYIARDLYNIKNNMQINFNGNDYSLPKANDNSHAVMMIIGMLYWLNAFTVSLSILWQARNKPIQANLCVLNRNVLVELSLVLVFGELAKVTNNYWIFWASYPIMDVIGVCVGYFLYHYGMKSIKSELNLVNLRKKIKI
ncbi:MAG: MATE family efflux transporter [Mycoplasma sp.]